MSVTFFNMIKHWDEFSKYLDHPFFIRYAKLRLWWDANEKENMNEKSQMEFCEKSIRDPRRCIELTEKEEKEIEFFKKKARENGPKSIYWWSALHDCVESSALVLAPLLCLRYNKTEEELYYLTIRVGENDTHAVLCNVPLERGMEFNLTMEDGNPVVIYDLIYPVFDEYEKFIEGAKCEIISCDVLKKNNIGMNYYQAEYRDLIEEVNKFFE